MEEQKEFTRFGYVREKIREGVVLDRWLAYWKFHNLKVAYVSGVFDEMNPETVEMLYNAAQDNDILVVGVAGDARANARHDAAYRSLVVAALECVDAVVVYNEPDDAALKAKITAR